MRRSTFFIGSLSLGMTTMPRLARAQAPPLSVRIAMTPNENYASGYFAQETGSFTRAGLSVDITTMGNGAAIAAGIVGGSIDIGTATPIAVATGYLHGVPLVIVAAGALSSASVRALMVCVSKTSGIKTAKDLEGKTVAVNALKSGSELGLDAWLDKNGADISKVKVIETSFPDMGPALDRGTIAGAVISEPALTAALKANNIEMIGNPDQAIAPVWINSCWFSTRDFVQKNPEVIQRFTRAIYETQRWANTHQYDSAAILAKYSKMDVTVVRSMPRAPWADQLRLSDIQPALDTAAKYGMLARPVSAANIVYQS
jgi:NitT/TauT family transport system substrate-binding protein